MFLLIGKVLVNAIVDALANIGRELLGQVDEAIPLLCRQACLEHLTGDAIFDEAIDEASVEIVACANGADGLCLLDRILTGEIPCAPHLHGLCALGIDEVLAVERYLCLVDRLGIVLVEHNLEVLLAASYDVGILQILQDIGIQLHYLVLMGSAEVHVVVDDGPFLSGILKEALHLRTDHGIHGIVRAEHHDVVSLYLWEHEVQTVVGVVLIEDVLRVVILVEEGQRYW